MSISSFEAIRYRGISGLSLKGLSRANLITGVNGVGKTALIEAIWLFTGRRNPGLLWNTNVQRSNHPVIDPVVELSDGFIELQGKENGKEDKWKIEFEPVEQFEGVPFGVSDADKSLQISIAGWLHARLDDKPVDEGIRSAHDTPWGAVMYGAPLNQVKNGSGIIEGTSSYSTSYTGMISCLPVSCGHS